MPPEVPALLSKMITVFEASGSVAAHTDVRLCDRHDLTIDARANQYRCAIFGRRIHARAARSRNRPVPSAATYSVLSAAGATLADHRRGLCSAGKSTKRALACDWRSRAAAWRLRHWSRLRPMAARFPSIGPDVIAACDARSLHGFGPSTNTLSNMASSLCSVVKPRNRQRARREAVHILQNDVAIDRQQIAGKCRVQRSQHNRIPHVAHAHVVDSERLLPGRRGCGRS